MKPKYNPTVVVIDDDETCDRNKKRRRSEVVAREDSDVVIMRDTADSDLEEISPRQFRRAMQNREAEKQRKSTGSRATKYPPGSDESNLGNEDENGDIVITACIGQDAGRDLPHLRPDCTVHRFNFGVFKSNYRHCAQCYCYACDVKASECKFWGTGLNAEDHANARPLVHWNRMRMAARQAGSPLAAATTAVTSAAVGGIKNPGSDQGPSGSAEGGGHLEARRVSRRQVDNGKKAPMKAAADRQKTFDAAAAAVAVAIITTAAAMEKRNSAPVRSRASVRAAAMVPAAMVATAPRTPASPTSSTEGCITRSKPRKSGNTRKAK